MIAYSLLKSIGCFMLDKDLIVDDPEEYGKKGSSWSPEFVQYMKFIVMHPVYEDMPDAVNSDGKIQWESPSNRTSGKHRLSHHKRRDWWKEKARQVGIDPESNKWISRTAKAIHPTGEKVCRYCGRSLMIAYCYPNKHLKDRLIEFFGEQVQHFSLIHISDLLNELFDLLGENEVLPKLPALFKTGDFTPPTELNTADDWLLWLSDTYIPSEPSLLSPGVMSNAPDRFDGFHHFNLCCRAERDGARNKPNMRSYYTDRRVFEYWSEGDWVAADRLMGLINSQFREEPCADGGDGPATADHIGPISLGFMHHPKFRLLSGAANSAKNNRMTLWDVDYLINAENRGDTIVSWYAQPLWDLRKGSVTTEEHALRLSKMMRDNQRIAMQVLCRLFDAKCFSFLAALLELEYADYKVDFKDLHFSDHVTVFEGLEKEPRTTKYSTQKKASRVRIAFNKLQGYRSKSNRQLFSVESEVMDEAVAKVKELLSKNTHDIQKLDNALFEALFSGSAANSEHQLRKIVSSLLPQNTPVFVECKKLLSVGFKDIAQSIDKLWDTERYVRANFDFKD